MKKLVLSMIVAAFGFAVQAADQKPTAEKPPCCASKASMEAKGECPMAKQANATSCKAAKQKASKVTAKQALKSPKEMAMR